MKIAFIGTHGTGKTTICHETVATLKKSGIDSDFIGEKARECPFEINESTTKNAQEWIIFEQYLRELEFGRIANVIICDRSVLDGYVYYYYKFGRNELLEHFVKEKIKTYSVLFKVPINQNYLYNDGTRSINPAFQKGIDKAFDEVLQFLNIPFRVYENLNMAVELIKENARSKSTI